jgi:excisionase family DNA binding protein
MSEPHEPAVDSHELARILGVSLATVYRHAKTGQITGIKVGSSWRFFPSKVMADFALPRDPWQQSARSLSRPRIDEHGRKYYRGR